MSDPIEVNKAAGDDGNRHVEMGISNVDDSANLEKDAKLASYKAAAIEAEHAEHNMGVVEAVKQYPMAAWWSFVMSCTIVRYAPLLHSFVIRKQHIDQDS